MINYTVTQCSLGTVLIALGQRGICWVSLGDSEDALYRELKEYYSDKELLSSDKQLDIIKDKIIEQIENPTTKGLGLSLNLVGTVFQKQVWNVLMKIPKGRTVTYSEIAACMGSPKAARAVASACAANKLAVLVPCHRVVRQDGQLSGYRWGVERKRELLRREKTRKTP